mmetsp:Transcript_9290/g.20277  ORF Transcript_9290/g.20277 Transcript_9290/m.20277 type:complete len:291 (+) Transcript_9290:23-895(+)
MKALEARVSPGFRAMAWALAATAADTARISRLGRLLPRLASLQPHSRGFLSAASTQDAKGRFFAAAEMPRLRPNLGYNVPQASAASAGHIVLGPMVQQVRFAGRKLGIKQKRKNARTRTVHQKGLGKRMEMYWPQHDMHRTRIPLYENSRRHVIWDYRMQRWMVMWYRHGMQVFRWFSGRGGKFEQGRTRAILFYQQLRMAGKLGSPKPDQCRSGVRGVFFDKEEKSWVARWSNCGMKTYAMFSTEEHGFRKAYEEAIRVRVQSVRQNHQFMFQRTRWKGQRRPLGQPHT